MEVTENVQATDNGKENAETSEEVKVQKSEESLSENNKPDKAEGERNEDKAELFRQAVLKSKRERAARAERILSLVAQFCGADKCDYDGIENAVSERNFERCRRNDMEYRLERWQKESEEVKQTYPQFDLAKEMNDRKWFWFAILYQNLFAYAVSLIVYQLGGLVLGAVAFNVWTIVAAVLLVLMLFMLFRPDPYKDQKSYTRSSVEAAS